MIGVIASPAEQPLVEEFFELFKTPWEAYQRGNDYEVVITTAGELGQISAPLVLVYGCGPATIDSQLELGAAKNACREIRKGEDIIPIYGNLATFAAPRHELLCATPSGESAAIRVEGPAQTIVRVGFNVFEELRFLLTTGQPADRAGNATLDLHIAWMREWIVTSGVRVIEIPPVAAGYDFAVSLSHDIDFVGIRAHKFDHTMFGFLYRALVGSVLNLIRGSGSFSRFLKSWSAVASLPFVYLGWAKDFWWPFDWYMAVEKGLGATYYIIPFKGRMGEKVNAPHAARRATAYDVEDIRDAVRVLKEGGCEVGVHGIDAWHSVEKGREECRRIGSCAGKGELGIRMHWLLHDERTFRTLEEAGFSYDSTVGYNDAIGYRSGTGQVYRPLGVTELLELPMHIQDGALFFSGRLNLSEGEAMDACEGFMARARRFGGVMTVIWHDRSHAAERFWGEFYARLVTRLQSMKVWFGTGEQITSWFRRRREAVFKRGEKGVIVRLKKSGKCKLPPMVVRVHELAREGRIDSRDQVWNGEEPLAFQFSPATAREETAAAAR
jgi:hypothetical protein